MAIVVPLYLADSPAPARLAWRERIRAQRHIRPHVNPLQRRFRDVSLDPSLLDFEDMSLPLHVDIGCGKGHFCADLSASRPDLNVLGIEIREQLVDEARRLVDVSEAPNLRFLCGSANELVAPCIDALGGQIASASVLFPDPWPKRRHQKRRVVQPRLVADLAARLPSSSGFVFLASDVQSLAEEMRHSFLASGSFELAHRRPATADERMGIDDERAQAQREEEEELAEELAEAGWLREEERPFAPVRTERERQALRRATPIWRTCVYRRATGAQLQPNQRAGTARMMAPREVAWLALASRGVNNPPRSRSALGRGTGGRLVSS